MTLKDLKELLDHVQETDDIYFVVEEQHADGYFQNKDVYVSSEVGYDHRLQGHVLILKPTGIVESRKTE